MTAEALAEQAPASFDVVTCMELLEHVPDPGSTVAACAGPQTMALANDSVDDTRLHEVCGSIDVGPSYEIQANGDVTLRARDAIRLDDGFDLRPGGRFAAVIDPSAAAP